MSIQFDNSIKFGNKEVKEIVRGQTKENRLKHNWENIGVWGRIEEILERNRGPLFLFGAAVFLAGVGYAAIGGAERTQIEQMKTDRTDGGSIVFETNKQAVEKKEGPVFVDVAGAVMHPGVYELGSGARVKDALVAAGGLAAGADREYVSRNVNLAAPIADGAKVYIPDKTQNSKLKAQNYSKINNNVIGASSQNSGLININTASAGELEKLKGIGEVRAKAIIDNRPYGSVDELRTKGILGEKTLDAIKNKITIY
jgi:competence protein ComEA